MQWVAYLNNMIACHNMSFNCMHPARRSFILRKFQKVTYLQHNAKFRDNSSRFPPPPYCSIRRSVLFRRHVGYHLLILSNSIPCINPLLKLAMLLEPFSSQCRSSIEFVSDFLVPQFANPTARSDDPTVRASCP
jgi:hypothetical protein